jgi:hypothetical protein
MAFALAIGQARRFGQRHWFLLMASWFMFGQDLKTVAGVIPSPACAVSLKTLTMPTYQSVNHPLTRAAQ